MSDLPIRVNSLELSREERRTAANMKRLEAAEAVALASLETVKFLYDVMMNEERDIQARLRAADLLMTRQIPKIAAQHLEQDTNTAIMSVDHRALIDSIIEQIKEKR